MFFDDMKVQNTLIVLLSSREIEDTKIGFFLELEWGHLINFSLLSQNLGIKM
jgi:hypothetical protein